MYDIMLHIEDLLLSEAFLHGKTISAEVFWEHFIHRYLVCEWACLLTLASLCLQQVARRSALGLMAGAAALLTRTKPSEAAFGDAANVFGK